MRSNFGKPNVTFELGGLCVWNFCRIVCCIATKHLTATRRLILPRKGIVRKKQKKRVCFSEEAVCKPVHQRTITGTALKKGIIIIRTWSENGKERDQSTDSSAWMKYFIHKPRNGYFYWSMLKSSILFWPTSQTAYSRLLDLKIILGSMFTVRTKWMVIWRADSWPCFWQSYLIQDWGIMELSKYRYV